MSINTFSEKKAHDEDISKRRQLSFLRLYLIRAFCPGFRCEAAAAQVFPCEPASVPVSEGSGFSAGGGAKPPEALGSPALVFPFIYFFTVLPSHYSQILVFIFSTMIYKVYI